MSAGCMSPKIFKNLKYEDKDFSRGQQHSLRDLAIVPGTLRCMTYDVMITNTIHIRLAVRIYRLTSIRTFQ